MTSDDDFWAGVRRIKRPANRPPHEPTKVDRDTVLVMASGGIAQVDIARARGISPPTLRKHYRQELAIGATVLNTIAITEHVKLIKAGDFQAIKWWQQARMGWTEHLLVDDGKPADTPMRVVVEFVGEAAAPRADQSAPRTGSRLPDTAWNTRRPPLPFPFGNRDAKAHQNDFQFAHGAAPLRQQGFQVTNWPPCPDIDDIGHQARPRCRALSASVCLGSTEGEDVSHGQDHLHQIAV
jgi:hypothetical protein